MSLLKRCKPSPKSVNMINISKCFFQLNHQITEYQSCWNMW